MKSYISMEVPLLRKSFHRHGKVPEAWRNSISMKKSDKHGEVYKHGEVP